MISLDVRLPKCLFKKSACIKKDRSMNAPREHASNALAHTSTLGLCISNRPWDVLLNTIPAPSLSSYT